MGPNTSFYRKSPIKLLFRRGKAVPKEFLKRKKNLVGVPPPPDLVEAHHAPGPQLLVPPEGRG